jgi:hypothetical protein
MYATCLLYLRNVSVATERLLRNGLNTLIKTCKIIAFRMSEVMKQSLKIPVTNHQFNNQYLRLFEK